MKRLNKWWFRILIGIIIIECISILGIWYLMNPIPSIKDLGSTQFEKCKKFYDQKDYNTCIDCLDRYILAHPEAEAFKMRGEAHYFNGDYEKAVADFTEFLHKKRTNRAVLYRRGLTYEKLGKLKEAEADFKKSCEFGYDKACNHLVSYSKPKPGSISEVERLLKIEEYYKDFVSSADLIKDYANEATKINKAVERLKRTVIVKETYTNYLEEYRELVRTGDLTVEKNDLIKTKLNLLIRETDEIYPEWKRTEHYYREVVTEWGDAKYVSEYWLDEEYVFNEWKRKVADKLFYKDDSAREIYFIIVPFLFIIFSLLYMIMISFGRSKQKALFPDIDYKDKIFSVLKTRSIFDRAFSNILIGEKLGKLQTILLMVTAIIYTMFGVVISLDLPDKACLTMLVISIVFSSISIAMLSRPFFGFLLGGYFISISIFVDLIIRLIQNRNNYFGVFEFSLFYVLLFFIFGFIGFIISLEFYVKKKRKENGKGKQPVVVELEKKKRIVEGITLMISSIILGVLTGLVYSLIDEPSLFLLLSILVVYFLPLWFYCTTLRKGYHACILSFFYIFALLILKCVTEKLLWGELFLDMLETHVGMFSLVLFFSVFAGAILGYAIHKGSRNYKTNLYFKNYELLKYSAIMLFIVFLGIIFTPEKISPESITPRLSYNTHRDIEGTELLVQSFHEEPAHYLVFSPKGNRLVSLSMDGVIKIWDIEKMILIHEYKDLKDINKLAYGSDDNYLVYGSTDVYSLNIKTGDERIILESNNRSLYRVSNTENFIAYQDKDLKILKIIDFKCFKEIVQYKANENIIDFNFSPDGKTILIIDGNTLIAWDFRNNKLQHQLRGYSIKSFIFSGDGQSLLAECDNERYLTIDLSTFRILYDVTLEAVEGSHSNINGYLCVSDNFSLLVGVNTDKDILTTWSLHDGSAVYVNSLKAIGIRTHAGSSTPLEGFFINDSDVVFYTKRSGSQIDIVDVRTGSLKYSHNLRVDGIWSKTSFHNRLIAFSGTDGSLGIWDVQKNKIELLDAGRISKIDTRLITLTQNSALFINEISTGNTYMLDFNAGILRTINTEPKKEDLWHLITTTASGSNWLITFKHDSFLAYFSEESFMLWDIRNIDNIIKVSVIDSKDNYLLRMISRHLRFYKTILLFDKEEGVALSEEQKLLYLNSFNLRILDNKYILSLLDVRGPGARWTLDFPIEILNNSGDKLLVSIILFTDGNWIVYTPDGYFDCSPDAAKYVTWKVGDEVYAFDQYWDEYYVPDLLYKVLHGEFVPGEKLDIPVPPSVEILDPTERIDVKGNTTTITVRATDDVKVEEVVVAVNGRPINTTVRDAIEFTEKTDKSVTFKATVPLNPGPNVIEVYAYDNRKTRSWEEKVYVTSTGVEEKTPDLYVLSVGVSKYKDESNNLKFAAPDAKSITDVLKGQKDLIYNQVHTYLLTDDKATTKGILNTIAEIRKTITMDDILVIFLAGHGVKDKDYKFYFLTHDSDLGNLGKTALVWGDFQKLLRDTPARNVIMMLDSCHSGFFTDPKSPFINADKLIGNMELKTGVIVISSSTGSEVSIEDPKWGHGVFTYALIEALKGKADIFPVDRKVFVGEMNLYVPTRVKELTKERQTPSIPRLENFTDFAITEIR